MIKNWVQVVKWKVLHYFFERARTCVWVCGCVGVCVCVRSFVISTNGSLLLLGRPQRAQQIALHQTTSRREISAGRFAFVTSAHSCDRFGGFVVFCVMNFSQGSPFPLAATLRSVRRRIVCTADLIEGGERGWEKTDTDNSLTASRLIRKQKTKTKTKLAFPRTNTSARRNRRRCEWLSGPRNRIEKGQQKKKESNAPYRRPSLR